MKHANTKWHKNLVNVVIGTPLKTEDCESGVTLYAGASYYSGKYGNQYRKNEIVKELPKYPIQQSTMP